MLDEEAAFGRRAGKMRSQRVPADEEGRQRYVGSRRDAETQGSEGGRIRFPDPTKLEERVRVLDAVLAALTETEKLRDESLVLRRQAEAQLRRVTVNIARIQEGYYRLVGMAELADRIRRSIRTRATRADLPAPDGGDGSAPDGPAPGDPGGPPPPPAAEPSV